MKSQWLLILLGMSMILYACSSGGDTSNPLLKTFNTPFQVPPFDKIQEGDFLPAFKEAIKAQEKEIADITSNQAAPTFANTVEALDRSGLLLNTVSAIFFNLSSANTSDSLQKIAKEVAPLLSQHNDNISLNKELFKRIKAVYDAKDKQNLSGEQSRLLEETYKNFIFGGAGLDEKQQERLRDINKELSLLSLKFGDNLLAETNGFQLVIDKKEDLAGLPQNLIDGAAQTAKEKGQEGKWMFTLHNPSVLPFLQYSEKRELREKIWRAWTNRGNNNNEYDNKETIKKIVNLRLERAKLFGYKNHAEYVLARNMAQNPGRVNELLMQLWEPALKVAKKEAADMQALIKKEGKSFKLEPWDWRYYAEKVRKEKYDLDEEQLKPYFELESVKKGLFTVVNKLWGLKMIEKPELPKYDKNVTAYEVQEADGKHIGILYMDFYTRASKRGGAWMDNYRNQYIKDGKDIRPVVTNVFNFSAPTANTPTLLTYDEVSTVFHEFGHGLHGLLTKCNYVSLSGTNVARDFVELPSQIMENWAADTAGLNLFAKHYKTGEVIPPALVDKITKSQYHDQGFATVEYLAASILDMKYHTMTEPFNQDVNRFEAEAMKQIGLIPEIISRYRSTYFAHIFSGGYSAGYYSYIWAQVLDADAFDYFKQNGVFDQKTAQSFRSNILERGNTEEPMELYKKFRGAEPSIQPLLKRKGLI